MAAKGQDRLSLGEGRAALLDATIRVVAANGLRGLTYRAVAKEAGVTHGLVAHHFGSRQALLHEAVREAARRSVDLSHLEGPCGSLDDLASGLAEAVRCSPDVEAFQLEVALQSLREPELRRHVRKVYRDYIKAVANQLSLAGFPDEDGDALARAIFACLDGLVLQQLVFERAQNTTTALDHIRWLLRTSVEHQSSKSLGSP